MDNSDFHILKKRKIEDFSNNSKIELIFDIVPQIYEIIDNIINKIENQYIPKKKFIPLTYKKIIENKKRILLNLFEKRKKNPKYIELAKSVRNYFKKIYKKSFMNRYCDEPLYDNAIDYINIDKNIYLPKFIKKENIHKTGSKEHEQSNFWFHVQYILEVIEILLSEKERLYKIIVWIKEFENNLNSSNKDKDKKRQDFFENYYNIRYFYWYTVVKYEELLGNSGITLDDLKINE